MQQAKAIDDANHTTTRPAAVPPAGQSANDDDTCFGKLMDGVSEEIEADGLLVVWHRERQRPTTLFFSEAWPCDGDTERDLIRSATRGLHMPVTVGDAVSDATAYRSGELLTATIQLQDCVFTVTGMLRRARPGQGARCREALTRMLPVLRPFLRLWLQRQDLERRLRGMTAALENSNVATFFLSCTGEMVFSNEAGRELLQQRNGVRGDSGFLAADTLAETLRLRAAIEHVCSAGTQDSGTVPVLALRRKGARALMLTLISAEGDGSDPLQRGVIAYAFDPDQDLSRLIEPACRFYGLSAGETRLTCSLARGASLAEAAESSGLREQTARSYLKQIFLKTETNRQAELVGLMLKSAVRTSPRSHARVF